MNLSNRGFAQTGAVIIGVVYLLLGLVGFAVTGFGDFVQNTNYTLLGFDLNPFHNVVHLTVGGFLLIIVRFGRPATEGALMGGGLVYLLAAFLGFANSLQILSMEGAGNLDNVLHLVSGSAAFGLGLLSASRNAPAERRGDPLEQG